MPHPRATSRRHRGRLGHRLMAGTPSLNSSILVSKVSLQHFQGDSLFDSEPGESARFDEVEIVRTHSFPFNPSLVGNESQDDFVIRNLVAGPAVNPQ
jgi:hypothetical protein